MAKLCGEIDSKSLLTFEKSLGRTDPQPLDSSEIYYSLAAAQDYAANAKRAYVGQKIVVIENDVVTHYSIEDTAGTLKELGSVNSVGDEKSIIVAENGTISLKGIDSLTFERDVLDAEGNPTGEKEAIQYQPLMTSTGLIWIEPSKTTVEGLATLIDALSTRVKALEDNSLTKTELEEEIKDLGELITTAQDRADEAYTLAESKVDSETYNTDKKALQDEDAAIRTIAEEAKEAIDFFLNSEEVDDVVNNLKEVKAELEKLTDATELAEALAGKADKTYVDDELAKKQDVIPEGTYEIAGAASTVKQEILESLNNKADKATTLAGYEITDAYTKDEVNDLISRINAGNEQSAGAVNADLQAYKTSNDSRVKTIEEKLNTVESNAEKNIIEKIKVNDTELAVDETDRSVNLKLKFSDLQDDSGFDSRITAAQNAADEAKGLANTAQATANTAQTAAKNAQDEVDALETLVSQNSNDIGTLKTKAQENATEIGKLIQADSDHKALYDALVATVNTNSNTIAILDTIYVKNDDSYKALLNNVSANSNSIGALQTNVNTINNKLGSIPEGSNLAQMIADATYNDTAIKALIQSNTDAIATEKGRIDEINTRLNSISNVMDFRGVKDEIPTDNSIYRTGDVIIVSTVEYVFDGTEWQAFGDASATGAQISALSNSINELNTKVDNLPLLQVDGTSIQKDENNVISIKEVSTDLLVQGVDELVLNGGTAAVTINS